MRIPRLVFLTSGLGTAIGSIVLLKDYAGGTRYDGNEMIYGHTVIITGANTGIGKETALDLARRGARVILACRDMEKATKAQEEIIDMTANKNVVVKKLDLASLQSIRDFAEEINRDEKHLEILINNAGIMRCPKMYTQEGFEMQLGVNHLGHFLLTRLLLDKMKKSAPSRIITVSSLAHTRGTINFDDINSSKQYDGAAAYSQSKLANVLFTKELAKRLEGTGVTANAVHPGIVRTEIGRHMSMSKSFLSSSILSPFLWLFLKTPTQGAYTTINCAVNPELEKVSGKYFSDCKEKEVAPQGNDMETAKRLWLVSESWTRLESS